MKQRELWSAKKFAAVVAELCEYAIDHYRCSRKDGTRKGFFWQDKRGIENQKQEAYGKAMSAVSYTIACLAAQHLDGGHGGVCSDEPFQLLRLWEDMSEAKRRKLALKFARACIGRAGDLASDWTVLLLFPDYIGDYGQETYLAHVRAGSAAAAQRIAQVQAHDASQPHCKDHNDFAVLAVYEGRLEDMKQ
jgi:hypothetical protein